MKKILILLLFVLSVVSFAQTKHVYIVNTTYMSGAPYVYDSVNYIAPIYILSKDSTEKYPQFFYTSFSNVIFNKTDSQSQILKIISDSATLYIKKNFPSYTN